MLTTIMRYWRYLPYEEKWFIWMIALRILLIINGLCCFGSETFSCWLLDQHILLVREHGIGLRGVILTQGHPNDLMISC